MMTRAFFTSERGFSLIELIVALMIIGSAVAGVLSMMSFLATRSADPMMQEQALMIGESYLEEILLKPFLDPSGNTTQVCPAPEAGGRGIYDNVCDYNGVTDVGPRDQFNNPIAGLEGYTVSVTVTLDGTVTLGPASSQVNNTGALRVLRVDVQVQDPANKAIVLTGYRTNYNCNDPAQQQGQQGNPYCLPL